MAATGSYGDLSSADEVAWTSLLLLGFDSTRMEQVHKIPFSKYVTKPL